MTFVEWFSIFLIIVIVVFLIIGLNFPTSVGSTGSQNSQMNSEIENMLKETRSGSSFGPWQNIANDNRSQCLLYTIVSTSATEPKSPIYDNTLLDEITPQFIGTTGCIDTNQLVAIKQQRTCGDGPIQKFPCIGLDGQAYNQGQAEIAYIPCNSAISECTDQLHLVAFNFNLDIQSSSCVVAPEMMGAPAELSNCNVTNSNQLLRIQRANPETLSDNPTGVYARIFDKLSNTCLIPEDVTNPSSNMPLVFGDCSLNGGFVWFLAPPIYIPSSTSISPQQIVFTNTIGTPPSSTDIDSFLAGNPLSAAITGNGLTLQPFNQNNASSVSNNYNVQFIDYGAYDVYSETPIIPNQNTNIPFYQWSF
jgi:hypothetical protein